MARRKWLAMFVLSMFLISSISALATSLISTSENHYVASAISTTVTYPNSDVSSLWIRRNGSDPGFDFGGANVSPSMGMNYFGTNILQVTVSYSFADVANTALFPTNSVLYFQIYDASYAEAVADLALTDTRIKGVFIDDFPVGLESPANVSAIYNATHHNDVTLGYNLTLGIVVYSRNYFLQSPYTWAQIEPWFDIIHFWFYSFTYQLLYPNLAGYEDDFMTFHSWLPEKEYWLGIYLHWYNVGDYPTNFTYEQMSIGGKLIKLGYATRYSILENFWIQHNLETSIIVRDFINNELQKKYSTVWYWGTQTALSYSNGASILNPLVTNIESYYTSYRFFSKNLQNFTVITTVDGDYMVWNLRTGNHQYPYFDVYNETAYYILEPNQEYRIMYFHLVNYTINTNTTLTSNTAWTDRLVTINANITLNSTLTITRCIIRFGNDNYRNSMVNFTYPRFGITMSPIDASKLFVYDSIIEPMNRAYPFHLTRTYALAGWDSVFFIERTVIACYSHIFRPAGIVGIYESTLFQVQPDGSNTNAILWLECPSYVEGLTITDSLIWNYDVPATIGIFLMPSVLQTTNKLHFRDNRIIGGNYGLWVDLHYSSNDLVITNHTSYPSSDSGLFTTFRFDRNPLAVQTLTIETYTMFEWSVKTGVNGGIFVVHYPVIANGLYNFNADANTTVFGVTTGKLTITYLNPWSLYRNNFSLVLFSKNIDTGATIDMLIWLLFVFMAPIAMAQVVPKIGFIFGIALMLVVVAFEDITFLPYMFMGMLTIGIVIFKWR